MVYANGIDEKITSAAEVRKFLREPETVRSIVLPKTGTVVAAQKGFQRIQCAHPAGGGGF